MYAEDEIRVINLVVLLVFLIIYFVYLGKVTAKEWEQNRSYN
jgi:hypothetical protein